MSGILGLSEDENVMEKLKRPGLGRFLLASAVLVLSAAIAFEIMGVARGTVVVESLDCDVGETQWVDYDRDDNECNGDEECDKVYEKKQKCTCDNKDQYGNCVDSSWEDTGDENTYWEDCDCEKDCGASCDSPGDCTGLLDCKDDCTCESDETPTIDFSSSSRSDWEDADSPVEVDIAYSDGGSGVDEYYYEWSHSTSSPANPDWKDPGWEHEVGVTTEQDESSSEDWYLHAGVKDVAGTTVKDTAGPYKVDTENPMTLDVEVDPDTNDWIQEVEVEATAEDVYSGLEEIRFEWENENPEDKNHGDYTIERSVSPYGEQTETYTTDNSGDWDLTVVAEDRAGNTRSQSFTVKIDSQAPETTISPDGTRDAIENYGYFGRDGWTNESSVDYTITVEDDGPSSGEVLWEVIDVYDYGADGGEEPVKDKDAGECPTQEGYPSYEHIESYDGYNYWDYTVAEDEEITCGDGEVCAVDICYYARDDTGNVEDVKRSEIFKIDRNDPELDVEIEKPHDLPNDHWFTWANVTAMANDDVYSGIYEVRFFWENDHELPPDEESATHQSDGDDKRWGDIVRTYNMTTPGEWSLTVEAEDYAGNIVSNFTNPPHRIDNEDPWVDIFYNTTPGGRDGSQNITSNRNVTFNMETEDNYSGIRRAEIYIEEDYEHQETFDEEYFHGADGLDPGDPYPSFEWHHTNESEPLEGLDFVYFNATIWDGTNNTYEIYSGNRNVSELDFRVCGFNRDTVVIGAGLSGVDGVGDQACDEDDSEYGGGIRTEDCQHNQEAGLQIEGGGMCPPLFFQVNASSNHTKVAEENVEEYVNRDILHPRAKEPTVGGCEAYFGMWRGFIGPEMGENISVEEGVTEPDLNVTVAGPPGSFAPPSPWKLRLFRNGTEILETDHGSHENYTYEDLDEGTHNLEAEIGWYEDGDWHVRDSHSINAEVNLTAEENYTKIKPDGIAVDRMEGVHGNEPDLPDQEIQPKESSDETDVEDMELSNMTGAWNVSAIPYYCRGEYLHPEYYWIYERPDDERPHPMDQEKLLIEEGNVGNITGSITLDPTMRKLEFWAPKEKNIKTGLWEYLIPMNTTNWNHRDVVTRVYWADFVGYGLFTSPFWEYEITPEFETREGYEVDGRTSLDVDAHGHSYIQAPSVGAYGNDLQLRLADRGEWDRNDWEGSPNFEEFAVKVRTPLSQAPAPYLTEVGLTRDEEELDS